MDVNKIIEKYYAKDAPLYNLLIEHSAAVTQKALTISAKRPELHIDDRFVSEAAMLHDIGIFLTHAPSIHCFGDAPYIAHGYLGSRLLQAEGFPRHALVCERHTGTGLSIEEIVAQNLPVPHRDMQPVSIEEKVICFADCFFSKTKLGVEKTPEQVASGLSKFGEASVKRFTDWCSIFL
ncbi:MAG: HDIG domain-containing protein [Prevotella sp.]|jgi:uncharacterized protein|nr:HDIG domain-containing protein [Prevotella sp.]